jgi:aryl-alcohol dehydrogenase-like predicted oxidoreductase
LRFSTKNILLIVEIISILFQKCTGACSAFQNDGLEYLLFSTIKLQTSQIMNYKLLGNSGLRVSELCLGTMTFGTEWGWGCDHETSQKIFDAYANAGGNFIDTANRYTEGTSEKMVGEFIKTDRDHFVVATKYTLHDGKGDPNYCGNHRKNMMRSVESSLKRLDTDVIDVLWLHAWDFTTPIEEVLRGLDDLIRQGKVHYIGISDTPAWIVSRANMMAELRGWTAFIGLQIEYSLIQRTPERDLLPMAKALNLTVTPWGALGSGVLTGKYLKGETGRVPENNVRRSERNQRIAKEVVRIADKLGITPTQVAIAWVRQVTKQGIVPLIGARKLEQLQDWLNCLNIVLPEKQMEQLDMVSKIELGFPLDFLNTAKEHIYGGIKDKIIV